MSYRVQVKIEVIDEAGLPVNIKGHSGATREQYSPSEFPLVTCTNVKGLYQSTESALATLNQLHSVIKPLVQVF